MTLSAAFSAGAAFAMLFVAFVLGALLVIAAVAVPVVGVVSTILWVHHSKAANKMKDFIEHYKGASNG